MNLEDHLGDIIRKARMMSGVSIEVAAGAAGLSGAELEALERTGRHSGRADLAGLAGVIGLDGQKLKDIANGWTPAAVSLDRWKMLRVITTADEDMSVNCFLAWDAVTREAAVFDTGFDAARVLQEIEANNLALKHIFITHGHSDHVDELPVLSRRFPSVRVHWEAARMSRGPRIVAGESIQLGSLRITHRPTPGHAADGVTYIIDTWPDEAPQLAIVGDALFAGSMGRVQGAWEAARSAVRKEVLSLPGSTLVCPGHGPLTTVAEELAHNPFF